MARPKAPSKTKPTLAGSASVHKRQNRPDPTTDRNQIAKPWQYEVYRQVKICGEARYAATLFASMAGRAEIGISEAQTKVNKPTWLDSGAEVQALGLLAPTVRERTKLIRDYMMHRIIAGECYLIARDRVESDPVGPDDTVWEIVAVTEIRKDGAGKWQVRHNNANWLDLDDDKHPVIRIWCADPEDRQEAWSPFKAMLSTLQEIEWLTKHIFAQVRSRLMSAGVWFLPDNMTYPAPSPDGVHGGAEALSNFNEAELFALALSQASMTTLDAEEISMPTIVLADPEAIKNIDQRKLIQFWSEIDDKAMVLRSDAIRRFALGMDLPPEQVLGSSGLAVTGAGGSAGSVNHWGVWANEEQTISAHIEPALDDFVGALTSGFLRLVVDNTTKVIAYDTSSLRLRQDRSKEAMEWYDRGVLKAEVALRETGFDPATDMMGKEEHRMWLLNRIAGGSATPEQVQAALLLMGVPLPVQIPAPVSGNEGAAPGISDRNGPRSLKDHPYEGPPRVDHEHNDAPFAMVSSAMRVLERESALTAASEVLVLRALEKAGNRVLNDGKRGKDRDRETPPHLAHLVTSIDTIPEFDFTLLPVVLGEEPAMRQALVRRRLEAYCSDLYAEGVAHSRDRLNDALKGL